MEYPYGEKIDNKRGKIYIQIYNVLYHIDRHTFVGNVFKIEEETEEGACVCVCVCVYIICILQPSIKICFSHIVLFLWQGRRSFFVQLHFEFFNFYSLRYLIIPFWFFFVFCFVLTILINH